MPLFILRFLGFFCLFSFFYSCGGCGKNTDTDSNQDGSVEKSINIKGSVNIDDIAENVELSPLPQPIGDDVAGEVTSEDIAVASLIQRSDLLTRNDLITRNDLLTRNDLVGRSDYLKNDSDSEYKDEYLLTYTGVDEDGSFSLAVPVNTTFYVVVALKVGDSSFFKSIGDKRVITLDSGESLIPLGKILSKTASGLASEISFPSDIAVDEVEIGFCDMGDDGFESDVSIYSFLDTDGDGTNDDEDEDSDDNEIVDEDEEIKILVDGDDEYLKEVSLGIETTFSISLSETLSNVIYYASIPSDCEFTDDGDGAADLTCTFIEEASMPVSIIAKSEAESIYAEIILNAIDTESTGTYWKLTGSGVTDKSNFGGALSISGNFAAVGDVNDSNQGVVYVFSYDGTSWNEIAKLTSDSPSSNDLFSDSIAIESDGDSATLVVTATKSYDDSLYVFSGNTESWLNVYSTEISYLSSNSGSSGMSGGSSGYTTGYESVSISGNSFIVGVPEGGSSTGVVYEGVPASSDKSGTAYIYTKNGESWEEEAKLDAQDTSSSSLFGSSVKISGDLAIIGAPGKNYNKGAAYIFKRENSVWTEFTKLDLPDNAYQFGASVAISGDYAIVGEYGGGNKPYGKAYIYKCDWSNSVCNLEETFGISRGDVTVDCSGNYAIAGATSGKIYLFENGENGWVPLKRKSGNPLIGFGQNLAITDGFYIISASTANSTYIYQSN